MSGNPEWRYLVDEDHPVPVRWAFFSQGYESRVDSAARVIPREGKWAIWIRATDEWPTTVPTDLLMSDDLEEAKRYAETVVRLEAA